MAEDLQVWYTVCGYEVGVDTPEAQGYVCPVCGVGPERDVRARRGVNSPQISRAGFPCKIARW